MREFYAKILLVGEYSVLKGSLALTVPFRKFSARLELPDIVDEEIRLTESNKILEEFYHFTSDNGKLHDAGMDFKRFGEEIERGLILRSDIPLNYGLGSSGALVAAVFKRYLQNLDEFPL